MTKVSIQKIDSLIRSGKAVKGLIRLKKNGHFASFEGVVVERKRASDGHFIVVVNNNKAPKRQDGKRWQSVLLTNFISIKD